jgi:hypothetical protein
MQSNPKYRPHEDMATLSSFLDLWLSHLFLHFVLHYHHLYKRSRERLVVDPRYADSLHLHPHSTLHLHHHDYHFRTVLPLLHCRTHCILLQFEAIRIASVYWKDGSWERCSTFRPLLQLVLFDCWSINSKFLYESLKTRSLVADKSHTLRVIHGIYYLIFRTQLYVYSLSKNDLFSHLLYDCCNSWHSNFSQNIFARVWKLIFIIRIAYLFCYNFDMIIIYTNFMSFI